MTKISNSFMVDQNDDKMRNKNMELDNNSVYKELINTFDGRNSYFDKLLNENPDSVKAIFDTARNSGFITDDEIGILYQKLGCLLGYNDNEIDECFKHKLSSTKDDNCFVKPQNNYSRGWDMISSAEMNALNQAFEYFYDKFTANHAGVVFTKELNIGNQRVVLSFNLPSIIFKSLYQNPDDIDETVLKSELFFDSINVKAIDGNEEFKIPNVRIIADFILQNIVTSSQYDNNIQELSVYLSFSKETLIYASLEADKPASIDTFSELCMWNGLIEILNDKIIPVIIGNLGIDSYKLLSVKIKSETYDKLEPFMPTYANYNGSNYDGGGQTKSLLCMFAETINSITGKNLKIDIDKELYPSNNDNSVLILSNELVLNYVLCPLLNQQMKEKGVEFTTGADDDGPYLISENELYGKDGCKEIKMNDIKLRFIDNGIHIEGNIEIVCAKISKFSGIFMMNGNLKVESGKCSIEFNEPYLDINLSLNWIGRLIEFILGLTGIGIIIDLIGEIVIAAINIFLDFSSDKISELIQIPDLPIEWNNLEIADISTIQISDGVKMSLKLKVPQQ